MESSSKKRKTAGSTPAVQPAGDGPEAGMPLEYLDSFKRLKKSWPKDMKRLLDPSLPDERRSELWEMMCEGGDVLRQRYVITDRWRVQTPVDSSPTVNLYTAVLQ